MNRKDDEARGEDALAELLAPMDTDDFFDAHWERAPLHVSRPSDRSRFADLLSSSRIESLLGTRELRHPAVQLSRAEDPVPVPDYTDATGRVLPRRLLEHHAAGASLVLSGAHREFDTLAAFRRRMERALQLRCQTNVYRSRPGRQGFHAHHDTHDVFVLQLEGCKRFDFHRGGLELPLAEDSFRPALHPAGEFADSVLLEPGDTLYIPRGITHDALAAGETPSLHVTLGVFAVTVHDALAELLRVAAERDVALRRSLDRTLWSGATGHPVERSAGHDAERLADLLADAFSPERLDEALARLRDELSLDNTPDCTGRLELPEGPAPLGAGATLTTVPEAILNVERRGTRLLVRTFGQTLEFDPPLADALEQLLRAGSARLDELPSTDDEQRVALGRRLLDAGIARRTATEPPTSGN